MYILSNLLLFMLILKLATYTTTKKYYIDLKTIGIIITNYGALDNL